MTSSRSRFLSLGLFTVIGLSAVGLSAAGCSAGGDGGGGGGTGSVPGDTDGDGVPDGTGGGGGINVGGDTGTPTGDADNPGTCAEAASNRTYVGCEFYPTVTYNKVHEGFDFAVVLANGGTADATVSVSGGALTAPITETVPAGGLKAITLPWVPDLKGPIWAAENTGGGRDVSSVRVDGGAYKVETSVPVTAWQFSPLQFAKEGVSPCYTSFDQAGMCFSVSNDASLLVPATAMTENYRVFTRSGAKTGSPYDDTPGGMAITATRDNTTVTLQFGPNCEAGVNDPSTQTGACIAGGTGVTAAGPGEVVDFTMNAGDVVQLLGAAGVVGTNNADVSGTVIQSTEPVQVIAFNPITNMPDPNTANADHIEELVLPAEVIGKEYVVVPPSNPTGIVKGGHVVRIYGNVDGTNLTYDPATPAGAPTTIGAGQVVELAITTSAFKVTGDQPFAVGSYMLGGGLQGDGSCPNYPCSGDPAMSMMVTPEQFRTKYTFLAPTDYDTNFADVLIPDGATATLDGAPVTGAVAAVPGWSIARVPLGDETGGAHRLEATAPVGLQVMGHGHATSYYYPGGLNLKLISEPPPIIIR